ncbi:hypothetical protein [Salinarimonas rosea]|uniref:hypothetical protein n=1 Tax=Salinarimonas rosea TaxID=552063 RepID=UPI0012ECA184|nr:hypothetical protein [Salinarimonas rosea]
MNFPDNTTGDLIMQDYLGRIGMQTGTLANTLALEARAREKAAAAEARRREKARPAPPPPLPVWPTSLPVRPAKPPVASKPAVRTIPWWKWYLAGVATGLILPLFF